MSGPLLQSNVVFKISNKFLETAKKYGVTPAELNDFKTAKMLDPMAKYGSKDYPYCGEIGLSGTMHAGLRTDLNIVYKLSGRNPTVIYLYCFVNHEDSGTGNPPKQKKQKLFAKSLSNMQF